MSLNIAFLKAKAPYFLFLFLVGIFAQVLLHGFMYSDLLLSLAISVLVTWKPNIFCVFSKKDAYNFMPELPLYLLMTGVFVAGGIFCIHLQTITMNYLSMAIMCLLMTLSLIIVDVSRYTD